MLLLFNCVIEKLPFHISCDIFVTYHNVIIVTYLWHITKTCFLIRLFYCAEHSLHLLLCLLCEHNDLPPHSLQRCFCLPWVQTDPPLQIAHCVLRALWAQAKCLLPLKPLFTPLLFFFFLKTIFISGFPPGGCGLYWCDRREGGGGRTRTTSVTGT